MAISRVVHHEMTVFTLISHSMDVTVTILLGVEKEASAHGEDKRKLQL